MREKRLFYFSIGISQLIVYEIGRYNTHRAKYCFPAERLEIPYLLFRAKASIQYSDLLQKLQNSVYENVGNSV